MATASLVPSSEPARTLKNIRSDIEELEKKLLQLREEEATLSGGSIPSRAIKEQELSVFDFERALPNNLKKLVNAKGQLVWTPSRMIGSLLFGRASWGWILPFTSGPVRYLLFSLFMMVTPIVLNYLGLLGVVGVELVIFATTVQVCGMLISILASDYQLAKILLLSIDGIVYMLLSVLGGVSGLYLFQFDYRGISLCIVHALVGVYLLASVGVSARVRANWAGLYATTATIHASYVLVMNLQLFPHVDFLAVMFSLPLVGSETGETIDFTAMSLFTQAMVLSTGWEFRLAYVFWTSARLPGAQVLLESVDSEDATDTESFLWMEPYIPKRFQHSPIQPRSVHEV
jgi:hypothetical protein